MQSATSPPGGNPARKRRGSDITLKGKPRIRDVDGVGRIVVEKLLCKDGHVRVFVGPADGGGCSCGVHKKAG
jgi:hypothetical protein